MFLVGILGWWYGSGWRQRLTMVGDRIAQTSDYFSIGSLILTLFSPFRQISAGQVSGGLEVQLRAFLDRLISRCIGAIVRSFMIIFGLLTICVQAIFGVIILIVWAFIPLFPIVGLLMMVVGWVPTWL